MPLSVATSKKLVGVWPDVLTPLQPNLGIDLPKMASHIRNLAVKGVEHVTLFGYAGEGASFAADEKLEALAYLLKSGVEGPDILLGVNSSSLVDVVRLIQQAHAQGVRRFLVSPPLYYQPLSNSALLDFFEQVIAKVNLAGWQMYVHVLGGVSHADVPEAVLTELIRAHPLIMSGIVDQDQHASHTLDIMRSFGTDLTVTSCHEPNLQMLKPTGTVSALANLIPGVVKHVLAQDMPAQASQVNGMKVRHPDDRIVELMTLLGEHPPITALKFLLTQHYRLADWEHVRPPQARLSAQARESLMKSFKTFNLLPSE